MNFYAIPTIFSTILCSLIGLFVLLRNKNSLIHISFFFFCLSLAGWQLGHTISYLTESETIAKYSTRFSCIIISLSAPLFYYFIMKYFNFRKEKKWVALSFVLILIQIPFLLFTEFFLSYSPYHYFFGYYSKAGPLHPVHLLTFYGILLRILFLMLLSYKKIVKNRPQETNRLKYISIAFFFCIIGGIDYIPKYGIEFYPFGFIFVLVFIFIMAYAVIKHQLLDINIVIKKGLVYSLSVSLITVLFLILVLISERLSQNIFGYKSTYGSILAAIVIALAFTPLRNKVQEFFDRIFYKGTTDEIAQQNELLRKEVAQAEKFKAVATLASGMAHEIKNPLTAIKTFTEYLPDKKNDPEFLEKFSQLVGKEADRVDNLVHELLEFARPSPLTLKDTNIHKLLDETLDFLSSKLVKHNIKTEKAFKSDIELLKADPNQLKQVFLNLFMNAIDAMERGGTLTISTLNPNSSTLSIRIKDTGCGIPKEDLKHIFDPFFTKKDNGTGLGLAISYGIIKEHHGDIKVKSKPNEGTEFIIELMVSK